MIDITTIKGNIYALYSPNNEGKTVMKFKSKASASYPKVRCWKCNRKFRSNVNDSKKPMFVCDECHKDHD